MYASISRRSASIPLILAFIAIATGLFIPYYTSALNNRLVALAILPIAVVGCALFFLERKWLLLAILLTRASMETVLESTRGDGMGLGAAINVAVILIALSLFIEKPTALPRASLLAWMPFFAAACIGLLLSPDKGHAIRLFLTWVTNLSIFGAAFFLVQKQQDFRAMMRIIVWSSVLPTLYGLVQIVMLGGGAISSEVRLQSTFTHANIYAFYLVLVIWVCVMLLKTAPLPSHAGTRTCLLMYAALLLGQLLLTQTRAAWFICLALFVAYALIFERRYLLYMLLLVLLAMLSPIVRDRVLDVFSNNSFSHYGKLDSWSWRVELWSAALYSFEWPRLFTGYGIGAFRENAPLFFSRSGGVNWDAHNVYIQWFYDVGLLGLCTYLWLHWRLFSQLRPLYQQDRITGFMVGAMIIGYLIVSLSDNMMYYLVFNWYYWFLVGAACALASVAWTEKNSSCKQRTAR